MKWTVYDLPYRSDASFNGTGPAIDHFINGDFEHFAIA
jgi:hypothetical protein